MPRSALFLCVLLFPAVTIAQGPPRTDDPKAGTRDGPVLTRLFFSPTAVPAPAGEWSAGIHELFLPFVEFGAGGSFTLSAGYSLLPGADGRLFILLPKISVRAMDGLDASAGIMLSGNFGMPARTEYFAVGTVHDGGTRFTATAGWRPGREANGGGLVTGVGAMVSLGGHVSFVSDNRMDHGPGPTIFSVGFRYFRGPCSADLGLLLFRSEVGPSLPVLPWVSFACVL